MRVVPAKASCQIWKLDTKRKAIQFNPSIEFFEPFTATITFYGCKLNNPKEVLARCHTSANRAHSVHRDPIMADLRHVIPWPTFSDLPEGHIEKSPRPPQLKYQGQDWSALPPPFWPFRSHQPRRMKPQPSNKESGVRDVVESHVERQQRLRHTCRPEKKQTRKRDHTPRQRYPVDSIEHLDQCIGWPDQAVRRKRG